MMCLRYFTSRRRGVLSPRLRFILTGACLLLAIACSLAHAAPATLQTHTILVLYSSDRLLPADIEADRGLRAAVSRGNKVLVEVCDEFLDEPRFGGAVYEQAVATYLRDKYASRPPEIVVVGGDEALAFALRERRYLFPQVPLVHMGVTQSFLQSIRDPPRDLLGVPIQYDYTGTIEQALRSHPQATKLVVITGAAETDRKLEAELRAELSRFSDRVRIEFLAGLPTDELTRRLRGLTTDSIVFTPGYDRDGTGRLFIPRQAAELIAGASGAPVYGPYDTFVGAGIVGGRMPTYESAGSQAGDLAAAVLGGVPPGSIALPQVMKIDTHVDWRQVRRWKIDEATIPKDAMVHFREPTLWEGHRTEVLASGTLMVLLAALAMTLARTTAALRASEQRMILAAQAAKLAMWVWDVPRDQIRGVIAFQPLFAPTGNRPITIADVLSTMHPSDRDEVNRKLQDAVSANRGVDLQYRTLTPDSQVRWLAVRGQPDPHSNKRWLGVVLDITEQKHAEGQAEQDRMALLHMTRVSMLGQMLASIAHQLNQPLGAILANAQASQQVLTREPVDLAQAKEICDDIVTEVQRAAEVINRLNALFKRRPMEVAQVDVNALVTDTLKLAMASLLTQQIFVRTELAETSHCVDGDKVQLQQVLLNLIMNAADAMRTSPVVLRQLLIRTEGFSAAVALSVTDHGTGISAEDLPNVFEPFWSSKPSGMGIGLSICRSIVVAHHGTLVATNNPTGGATFSMTLPSHRST
jgi:C4-dicarboxylate-specific signal transduction histidine kinase